MTLDDILNSDHDEACDHPVMGRLLAPLVDSAYMFGVMAARNQLLEEMGIDTDDDEDGSVGPL